MHARSMVRFAQSVLAAALVCAVLAPPQPASAAGYNEERGPNYSRRVVLTFDDCPRTLAAFKEGVDYARKANIGLVIAPTGWCIRRYRDRYGVNLAQYARDRGQY
ncbi:hypothetical protein HER39_14130, partial [Arthrobacter deserti]|nr:hypothetical protein [Arthrobacter deserti]